MKLWIAGLAASVALVAPAHAEVVAQSEAGFIVQVSAEVTASPQDAWKTLVTPAEWWSKAHTFSGDAANLYLDSQATGCFCEKLPAAKGAEGQRPGSVAHMQIVYVEPGKALRMVGALGPLQSEAMSGTLTITLKPVGGNTRILWEYVVGGYMRYKTAEIAPAVDKVLAEQLDRLAAKLGAVAPAKAVDGKTAAPDSPIEPADDTAQKPEAQSGEAPRAADAKVTAPARPVRRRPKPDEDYVEPTR